MSTFDDSPELGITEFILVDIEASLSRLLPDKTRREFDPAQAGGSMYESGVYPLLPIFRLLGTDYKNINIYSRMENGVDIYTKGVLRYPTAVCSFKLGLGIKTEGNLVISGTKGYAYVPAPWQKEKPEEIKQNIYRKTAIHRFATVDEVVDAYRFCIDNSFVNGSLIEVNGGYCYK